MQSMAKPKYKRHAFITKKEKERKEIKYYSAGRMK